MGIEVAQQEKCYAIYSTTPLHVAVMNGHVNIVEFLMKEGADPCAMDKAGMPAFHEAVDFGRVDVVELMMKSCSNLEELLAMRGSVCYGSHQKGNALTVALRAGRESVARLFIPKYSSAMLRQCDNLQSPIHIACWTKSISEGIIFKLLERDFELLNLPQVNTWIDEYNEAVLLTPFLSQCLKNDGVLLFFFFLFFFFMEPM